MPIPTEVITLINGRGNNFRVTENLVAFPRAMSLIELTFDRRLAARLMVTTTGLV